MTLACRPPACNQERAGFCSSPLLSRPQAGVPTWITGCSMAMASFLRRLRLNFLLLSSNSMMSVSCTILRGRGRS